MQMKCAITSLSKFNLYFDVETSVQGSGMINRCPTFVDDKAGEAIILGLAMYQENFHTLRL